MIVTKRQIRRIIREVLLNETWGNQPGAQDGVIESLSAAVQEIVDGGKGLFDIATILGKSPYGFTAETVTSPLPMVIVDTRGKKYAIINAKYAEDPDAIVGEFAIGMMS